jgi:alkylation response protein AidB-like acyl-CoA dehydrogenase
MDFTFSDEQDALRDAVRSFLGNEAPSAYVRAMADDERGFTDELWRKIADVGWPGLLVPEEHGGLGLGLVDMDVVLEEMGRLPFPGPFFSSRRG